MPKLYIDNHQRARKWLSENHEGGFEVYPDNITIHCSNNDEKKKLRELLVWKDGDIRDRKLEC